jgi:hypothetical protein
MTLIIKNAFFSKYILLFFKIMVQLNLFQTRLVEERRGSLFLQTSFKTNRILKKRRRYYFLIVEKGLMYDKNCYY